MRARPYTEETVQQRTAAHASQEKATPGPVMMRVRVTKSAAAKIWKRAVFVFVVHTARLVGAGGVCFCRAVCFLVFY